MSTSVSAAAPTEFIDVHGASIAYRRFGPDSGVPLVLTQRFRGTMDHWDPALLDVLASERRVIVFDNAGVGASEGETPGSIPQMAQTAAALIEELGYAEVDLLGWSMGGTVAQWLSLNHSHLVRRLVLAGTGPGAVPDSPAVPAKVWQVAGKPVNDDEDFLYLFFTEDGIGRSAGLTHLRRLDARLEQSGSVVSPQAVQAQVAAIGGYKTADAAYPHLGKITVPTFVANGAHDVMVPSYESFVLSQRLPEAGLILYPQAGHGFLFQYPEQFGQHVLEFLDTRATVQLVAR
ncbi:MAG: alpha/beta fold family hydrolase [Nocardia sp.]|uniref:alpha/beta fold hydrolase n=1 Tax=Nocardia sp. TaxID=1821 RepID=UPI002637B842|nr:alpha/beta hydrolase [Nocardia sp.]MCU1644098.1 alpha/beta fold family hydrolase [Nocardia sp.]